MVYDVLPLAVASHDVERGSVCVHNGNDYVNSITLLLLLLLLLSIID